MPAVYEIPPRKTPNSDDEYLEQMTKAIFQAGFSWRVIRNKWENFKQAFDQFNIDRVAAYGLEDLVRLVNNKGVVRNRQKIAASVENARSMKELIGEHGSFKAYLDSLDGDYYERSEELLHRFKHLGRTGVFVFLYCVNKEVPEWEER